MTLRSRSPSLTLRSRSCAAKPFLIPKPDFDPAKPFLIPNLIETVKGITGQEEKIFLKLAEARKEYVNAATVSAEAQAAGGVESALARLLVLPENYPQLRSSEAFLKLQDQLGNSLQQAYSAKRSANRVFNSMSSRSCCSL